MNDDLEKEIQELAISIEQKIEENKQTLDGLPDFEPRSQRSKKSGRAFEV